MSTATKSPMQTNTVAGTALRRIREQAGISLRELSARAGISTTTLSRFETGTRDLTPATYAHTMAALAALISKRAALPDTSSPDQLTFARALSKSIKNSLRAAGITQSAAARSTGIPMSTLRRRLDYSALKISELEALVDLLGVRPSELIRASELLRKATA